ncbi:MAG: hypothetical protein QN165_10470, partial [Armatimonadota bacterium]|nr:hypothetical protein [Armatimonadota bacterium]
MGRWTALAVALVLNGFLVAQMFASRDVAWTAAPREQASLVREDVVQERRVRAGERTVLEVSTTGLVEVVVYEYTGDA